ncbi:hypothetical protein TKK_0011085 [Trichogramma kaykai]
MAGRGGLRSGNARNKEDEEGPEETTADLRKSEKTVKFQETKERLESLGKVGGKTTDNRVQVRKATAGGGSKKGEMKNTAAEDRWLDRGQNGIIDGCG